MAQPRTASRAGTHGQPCSTRTAVRGGRTAVRGGTAGRAAWHGRAVPRLRAVRDFFGLFIQFCFIFSSLASTCPQPFESIF